MSKNLNGYECLTGLTKYCIKVMSFEELTALQEKIAKERWMKETKQVIINLLDVNESRCGEFTES